MANGGEQWSRNLVKSTQSERQQPEQDDGQRDAGAGGSTDGETALSDLADKSQPAGAAARKPSTAPAETGHGENANA